MKPEVLKGAWIIAVNKVVSKYPIDDPALDPFEATIIAGRIGELFSATRSLGRINGEKFDAYRKLSKLKISATKNVLKIAEELEYVDISWNSDPDSYPIENFCFLQDSKETVLEAVGMIFDQLESTKIERAILNILSQTLILPQLEDSIISTLIKLGVSEKDAKDAIMLAVELDLISKTRETESGQKILFNPHSFENNAEEAFTVLNELSPANREKALEILEYVKSNPGVPLSTKLDKKILAVLIKAGLIDYSKISTLAQHGEKYFPTAPYIWGVIAKSAGSELSSDLIDDAKLLLNSFRYGQFFSSGDRGKIKNPSWIVNALLRDGAIGVEKPARAIGTDYPLALSRGIVNVVESRIYPGRYSMELMKRDVAEAVKDVFDQKAILPKESQPTPEDLDRAGKFTSPGAVRVETELPPKLKKCHEELIFGLRTMRRDR
jgi:hypothetical protein